MLTRMDRENPLSLNHGLSPWQWPHLDVTLSHTTAPEDDGDGSFFRLAWHKSEAKVWLCGSSKPDILLYPDLQPRLTTPISSLSPMPWLRTKGALSAASANTCLEICRRGQVFGTLRERDLISVLVHVPRDKAFSVVAL